jgi:hypothetical protein
VPLFNSVWKCRSPSNDIRPLRAWAAISRNPCRTGCPKLLKPCWENFTTVVEGGGGRLTCRSCEFDKQLQ